MGAAKLRGCFSSASDNWRTPSRIYTAFMRAGFVDCFPFMSEEDELAKSYKKQKLYINPPYSQISRGGGVKLGCPASEARQYHLAFNSCKNRHKALQILNRSMRGASAANIYYREAKI